MADHYKVIGIMSGTSLDGIDLAYTEFTNNKHTWTFRLKAYETVNYTALWKNRLMGTMHASAVDFALTDISLGHLIAHRVNQFILKHSLKPDLVASHGHTVFHQPGKKLTSQIGNGAAIAAITGITTICDFRSTDVALQGQGAPLVPIGDRLLFGNYHYCLNIGGIANISFEKNSKRIAFDICPVNMALNYLAGKSGKNYDKDGILASKGKVNISLLDKLNKLAFYKKDYPKSLGAEWFTLIFRPLLDSASLPLVDKHATVVEHVCCQLKSILQKGGSQKDAKMLVTGGGAFHTFLVKKMHAELPVKIIIPASKLVNYKEALTFAFLGVLRWRNEINTLASVTGASKDTCSGAIYLP